MVRIIMHKMVISRMRKIRFVCFFWFTFLFFSFPFFNIYFFFPGGTFVFCFSCFSLPPAWRLSITPLTTRNYPTLPTLALLLFSNTSSGDQLRREEMIPLDGGDKKYQPNTTNEQGE
ncbi:hypothetical protein BDV26DRAFT_87603 [Aspergillus bertholletiae]|uniref:Uncharacterized protein n=1 Tax=Aspergillus bertholletiae TaxID=1226010 RepID=A0A5N7AUQ3_9EURO|nr:hypothetical protein BDV26DRAFT_87603 [Aspergillus bertholletiae]